MTPPTQDRTTTKQRNQVRLSSKVEKNLVAYAVTATAAGVGVLASAQAAEAKVVYTPANVTLNEGQPLPIDLNHDGVVDFFLFHYRFHTDTGGNALLACLNILSGTRKVCASSSLGTNALNAFRVAESMDQLWGAPVQPGAKIVGGDRFHSKSAVDLGAVVFPTYTHSHYKPVWHGPWMKGGKGVKNRYVGIKFQIKGRFHFGWARITVTTRARSFTATLTGYAYETVPGKGIVAGKTRGPEQIEAQSDSATLRAPVQQSATLGMLALGERGLSIWRREKSQQKP